MGGVMKKMREKWQNQRFHLSSSKNVFRDYTYISVDDNHVYNMQGLFSTCESFYAVVVLIMYMDIYAVFLSSKNMLLYEQDGRDLLVNPFTSEGLVRKGGVVFIDLRA